MNIDHLTGWQKKDVERRLRRNQGKLVEVPYSVWTEVLGANDEVTEVEEKKTATFFIGRMSPDQTAPVLSVLGAIFFGGANEAARADMERTTAATEGFDFGALLRYVKGENLVALTAAIISEDPAWVRENWSLGWVAKVGAAFFEKNDFFGEILPGVMELLNSLGLSAATEDAEPTPGS